MARLPAGAWVAVADGEKALFLENVGPADEPHLEVVRKDRPPEKAPEPAPDDPAAPTDDAGGVKRPGLAPSDFHHFAQDRLPVDLARMLEGKAQDGRFDALVLVAAPPILAGLREHLPDAVRRRVIAEVPLTLTHHPIMEIEKVLQDASELPEG